MSVMLLSRMLAGEDAFYFVDNQGSMSTLVRGSSTDVGMAHLAHTAALQQRNNRTRGWYEYVNTDANIGDLPSRGRASEAARMLRDRFSWPVWSRRMVLPPLPWLGADAALVAALNL